MKKKFRAFLRKYDEELFIFLGFALILIGAHAVHPTLAWFTAGAEFLVYAFLLAKGKK